MNISQALRRAKILKGRVAQWERRACTANVVDEGEKPTYTFEECVNARNKALTELLELGAAVAETNALTKITYRGDDITLAAAIRMLDNIKAEIAWTKQIPVLAQMVVVTTRQKPEWDAKERTTYRDVEHTQRCSLDTREQERLIDQLQENFDELNSLVEGANSSTSVGL